MCGSRDVARLNWDPLKGSFAGWPRLTGLWLVLRMRPNTLLWPRGSGPRPCPGRRQGRTQGFGGAGVRVSNASSAMNLAGSWSIDEASSRMCGLAAAPRAGWADLERAPGAVCSRDLTRKGRARARRLSF